MISVRLSDNEYDELCRLSASSGARSLSDLARDAMHLLLKMSDHNGFSTDPLEIFQAEMDRVNRRIDELRDHLMSSNQQAKLD